MNYIFSACKNCKNVPQTMKIPDIPPFRGYLNQKNSFIKSHASSGYDDYYYYLFF